MPSVPVWRILSAPCMLRFSVHQLRGAIGKYALLFQSLLFPSLFSALAHSSKGHQLRQDHDDGVAPTKRLRAMNVEMRVTGGRPKSGVWGWLVGAGNY